MNYILRSKKNSRLAFLLATFAILCFTNPKPGFSGDLNENNTTLKTAQARFAVEQAWETYHDAALGGTLASPAIQTELEMNLHRSRALLAEAYDAEDKGDMKTVKKIIREIMTIKQKVVNESRERKK
jgi:hypothetical protein